MNIFSSARISRIARLLHNYHFWVVFALFVILIILHYTEQLGIAGTTPTIRFGLHRHAMDRILFLLPIFYSAFIFGVNAGIIASAVTLFALLPRAILWSPDPRDAFFEIASVMLIAVVVCLWFRAMISEQEQRQRSAAELDTMQGELQSHIRLSRSHEIRLEMLNTISGMLSHTLELETLLRNAMNMVMEVMEVEAVLIFSLDEKSQKLDIIAYDGITDRFAQEITGMKVGEGFNGIVAQSGEPLMVKDASRDHRLTREIVLAEKIKAQLIVPLKAKGQVTGTLCVVNRRPRQFLLQEVNLLTAIGNQLAIAIDNARLYHEQQVTAAQYRGIFENASDAIWTQDSEMNILAANEATARLTGYTRAELFHMKTTDFLPEDGVKTAADMQRKTLRGDTVGEPYDQRLIRKDRTQILVRLTSNCIFSDGKPVGFQHIARDVTKERQVENNLRFFTEQVIRAQEEERKRIARELHDETAQQLIALTHQVEDFAVHNDRLSRDDINILTSWRDQLKNTLQGVRLYTRDLRPPVLDDLGLVPATEWLIDELKGTTGMKVTLKIIGDERRLSTEAELTLFRIVQEALANVRRHAEASVVEVVLEFEKEKIMVSIMDNGKGVELPGILEKVSHNGKLGLIGMEERARLLGGTLTIQSKPGSGMTITAELPV